MANYPLYDEWGEPMPPGRTLHILLYVDDRRFLCDYATRNLQDALTGGLIDTRVDVLARPLGAKLTRELLEKYDEVWFLLRATAPGQPLTREEIDPLYEWMNRGGGVLIAGDHCEMLEELGSSGVGAPVGLCVPRARDLRLWDDGPGTNSAVAFDTTEYGSTGLDVDPKRLERDERPQRLLLPTKKPNSGLDAYPHPIFRDSMGRWLDRFPEHRHEGQVQVRRLNRYTVIPLRPDWPEMNVAEAPTVIASAVNWRRGETQELMAQWDGHLFKSAPGARYGRILADSSFHHYVDDNLAEIVVAGGENWRKIREIYRNQAAWLAPPEVRDAYTERAVAWVRAQPCYQDAQQEGGALVIYELLARALPAAWLHEHGDRLMAKLVVTQQPTGVQEALPQHLLAAAVELDAAQVLTVDGSPSEQLRTELLNTAINSYAATVNLGAVEKIALAKSIL